LKLKAEADLSAYWLFVIFLFYSARKEDASRNFVKISFVAFVAFVPSVVKGFPAITLLLLGHDLREIRDAGKFVDQRLQKS
jgi:hypothetical protein